MTDNQCGIYSHELNIDRIKNRFYDLYLCIWTYFLRNEHINEDAKMNQVWEVCLNFHDISSVPSSGIWDVRVEVQTCIDAGLHGLYFLRNFAEHLVDFVHVERLVVVHGYATAAVSRRIAHSSPTTEESVPNIFHFQALAKKHDA